MPLFSFKKLQRLQDVQKANHRTKNKSDYPQQYMFIPDHDAGSRASNTLQRESLNLIPALKPVYKALDPRKQEIRLLSLHPGKANDLLVCTFKHTSVDSKHHISFETVSYCWGRDPGKAVIELDQVPVQVTRSAARVLHRMRYPDRCRILWVDAICINQDDVDEKNHQVAMMGTIYGKTARNLVWLGEDHGYAEEVATALEVVMTNLRKETVHCYNLFYLAHTRTGNRDLLRNGTSLCPRTRKCLPVLEALYSSPWFGRLWVAQEVALAPDNLCHFGRVTFPLSDVLRVAVWLVHNTKQVPHALMETSGFRQAMMLWYLVDHEFVPSDIFERGSSSLFSAWHSVQWMEARHAKDNVYALLGLVRSRKPRPASLTLVPDYTKPDAEVFRDATRIMIEERRLLSIFQHRAENGNEASMGMPSWVTCFDVKIHNNSGPRWLSYPYNAHNNCCVKASTVSPKDGLNVLSLHGILVDRVAEQTNCMPSIFDSNVGKLIHEALRIVYPGNWKPDSVPVEFTERLAITLMAGYNWLGHPAGSEEVGDFVAFMKYMRKHGTNPPVAAYAEMQRYDKSTQRAIRCFLAIAIACSERRFFVTADGRFGLGPRGLTKGDIVTVLYGGALPFALRSVSKERYRYVGACYISGIMNGEAMRKHKADREDDTVFHII